MVKEIKNREYYQCEICKLKYKNKKMAEKCQAWSEKHKSCDIEITKFAVKEK